MTMATHAAQPARDPAGVDRLERVANVLPKLRAGPTLLRRAAAFRLPSSHGSPRGADTDTARKGPDVAGESRARHHLGASGTQSGTSSASEVVGGSAFVRRRPATHPPSACRGSEPATFSETSRIANAWPK